MMDDEMRWKRVDQKISEDQFHHGPEDIGHCQTNINLELES